MKKISLLNRLSSQAISSIALLGLINNAWALAGLDTAKTAADDIQTGLYALVGVVGLIYLIWLGVSAFTERKSWADFGWGVIHISFVGGAIALGTWAWSLFA